MIPEVRQQLHSVEVQSNICFQTYILVNVQGMVVSIVEYFIFREATESV